MTTEPQIKRLPLPPDTLPESPCWHKATKQLFWVDHATQVLQRFGYPDGDFEKIALKTDGNLRFVKAVDDERLLIGSERGLYYFHLSNRVLSSVPGALPLTPATCINDGAVSRDGLIAIAISDIAETSPTGGFYLQRADGSVCICDQIIVANGPAFSVDDKRLHLSDTFGRRILQFDIDRGEVTSHLKLAQTTAYPDGLFVDKNDALFVSYWGGGRIDVYADGQRTTRFQGFPLPNVTCCCLVQEADSTDLIVANCADDLNDANGLYQLRGI